MELNKGFKQTEAGVIPIDWNLIEVDKISSSIASGRSKQDSQFGDFPLYGSTGIIGSVSRGEYSGEAILVARVGANAGRLNIVSGSYGVTDNTIIVKINSDIPLQYVWRQLEAKKLNRMVFGSGQPLITGTQIKAIKIPLPTSRNEQEIIVNALSDVDSYIESLEKLIAKKRLIKKGVMQELLTGKRRLDGFKDKWKEYALGTLIKDFRNGYAFSASDYVKIGVPIITMAQIGLDGNFQFAEESVNYWPHDKLQKLSDFLIHKNDLLIAMTDVTPEKNLIGRMSVVNVQGPLLLNQRVGKIATNTELLNPHFLWHFSNSSAWRDYCIASATLGVQANIGTKDILSGKIILPNIKEQDKIVEVVRDIDIEINNLSIKLQKARLLKQGMMQELLTGRIRLV